MELTQQLVFTDGVELFKQAVEKVNRTERQMEEYEQYANTLGAEVKQWASTGEQTDKMLEMEEQRIDNLVLRTQELAQLLVATPAFEDLEEPFDSIFAMLTSGDPEAEAEDLLEDAEEIQSTIGEPSSPETPPPPGLAPVDGLVEAVIVGDAEQSCEAALKFLEQKDLTQKLRTETATLEAAAESGVVRRVSEAGRDSRSVQRLFKAFKRMDKLEEAMGENSARLGRLEALRGKWGEERTLINKFL